VPVGTWVLAYYDRYLEERLACPRADACDFVLVNLFHRPLGAPMTASAVRQSFRTLSRRAGLSRAIHPHMLRHSAGASMTEAGVGLDVVQALLGHRSITSTRGYAHTSQAQMRNAVEAIEKDSIERRARRRNGDDQ
jgi:site-specific recombinase XerD